MATQCPRSSEKRRPGVTWLNTNTPPDKDAVDRADSGYGSSKSTLDGKSSEAEKSELEHRVSRRLFSRLRKKKLKPFDQEISQAVQDRFSDLTELFGPSLYAFLLERRVKYNAISIKLKVLGEDERSAKPWVVVQCDEAASKPIRNFFDQKEVKMEYRPDSSESDLPSFDVVTHPHAPKSLAALRLAVYGNSLADVETLCGKTIIIGSIDQPHIVTLGGVVKVEMSGGVFVLYGLTAGHVLMQQPVTGQDNRLEIPSTDIDTADSLSEAPLNHLKADDENAEVSLLHDVDHPQGEKCSADRGSTASLELYEEEFELDLAVEIDEPTKVLTSSQDSSLDITAQDLRGQSWSQIGSIYSRSRDTHARLGPDQQSRPDQDWALVNIAPVLYRPNLLPDQPIGAKMVELTQLSRELDESEGSPAVVIISGIGGLKRGNLSLSPSFLMFGQAKSFTKTYNLLLHQAPVPNIGDSGSWVVDEESNEVYGHLVASDALGEAYVVPFDQTLLDIKHCLGAESVCLPSRSDISPSKYGSYPHVIHDSPSIPDSGYHSVPRRSEISPQNDGCYTNVEAEPRFDSGYSSLKPSWVSGLDSSKRHTEPAPHVDPIPKEPSRTRHSRKSIFAKFMNLFRK